MTNNNEKNENETTCEDLQEDTIVAEELDMDETADEALPVEDQQNLASKLGESEKKCEEYLDLAKRTKAEFDNYRKRAVKEKESMYDDGFVEGIKQVLPVIDNLERAVASAAASFDNDSLMEGVQMVLKMFGDAIAKANVEEIPAEGEKFDPHFHNAVMHIEDDQFDENVVVEVLQKGYKYKDKVIRYSMVKVAN